MLLSGKAPFNGKDTDELFKMIKTTNYDFYGDIWETDISKEA